MVIDTNIFSKTEEGLRLKKLLEASIQMTIAKHHVLGHEHKRIKSEKNNKLMWKCIDCDATLEFDFKAGKVKGTALKNECSGRNWDMSEFNEVSGTDNTGPR